MITFETLIPTVVKPAGGSGIIFTGGVGGSVSGSTYIPPRREVIGELAQEGYWVKATGSRVTQDGWTEHSDWDYVVYDPEGTLQAKLDKPDSHWVLGGSGNGELGSDFLSYKREDVNLILVNKDEYWKKYIIATNLLKLLNPKTKKERIALFDSVFGRTTDSKAMAF